MPPANPHVHKTTSKKKLSPLRPKSVNLGSIDGNLSKSIDGLNMKASIIAQPGSHTVSGISWQQQQQHQKMVPVHAHRNSEGVLQGWSSFQRLGQHADIQALMRSGQGMPSSSFNTMYDAHKPEISSASKSREYGSAISVEITQELFTPNAAAQPKSPEISPIGSKGSSPLGPSPQASNSQFHKKVDPIQQPKHKQMKQPISTHHAHLRSISAKPSKRRSPYQMGHHAPEHSNSMGYMGVEQHKTTNLQEKEPANLEDNKVCNSPSMF